MAASGMPRDSRGFSVETHVLKVVTMASAASSVGPAAAIISAAATLTPYDAGKVYVVVPGSGFTITLPPLQHMLGCTYDFQLAGTGGSVLITVPSTGSAVGAAPLKGTITSDVAVVASGSTATFVTAKQTVGDNIRVQALSHSATVAADCIVAIVGNCTNTTGGITVA